MKTITAKYSGVCKKTGARILAGDLIQWSKAGAVLIKANRGSDHSDLFVIGGREFIRNARGRCEDAPCCGCCTI